MLLNFYRSITLKKMGTHLRKNGYYILSKWVPIFGLNSTIWNKI